MRRWLVAVLLLAACDGPGKREAESLVAATDRYRRASNDDKPAAIDDLRKTRCSAADVCRARVECMAFAEATTKSLVLKSEVEAGLINVEAGKIPRDSAEAKALPVKLDEAEKLLKEGYAHLEPCDNETMALRRRYRF